MNHNWGSRQGGALSVLAIIATFSSGHAVAQRAVVDWGVPVTEGFDGFTGAGLTPAPTGEALDSNEWRIQVRPDATCDFGETCLSQWFARGTAVTASADAGIFALLAQGPENPALGMHPSETVLTPGYLTWRLRNDTDFVIEEATLSFIFLHLNDAFWQQFTRLETSMDDDDYVRHWSRMITRPSDEDPQWIAEPVMVELEELAWQPGTLLYLRWSTDEASGIGDGRPKVALDDLSFTAHCSHDSDCDDGNPCTGAICASGACHPYDRSEGVSCDDGDPCNGQEICDGQGSCVAGSPPECDDGDPCTDDLCEPMEGCVFEPIAACGQVDAGVIVDAGALVDAGVVDGAVTSEPVDAGHVHEAYDIDTVVAGSGGATEGGAGMVGSDPGDEFDDGELPGSRQTLTEEGCDCHVGRTGAQASGQLLTLLVMLGWLFRRRMFRVRPATTPRGPRRSG